MFSPRRPGSVRVLECPRGTEYDEEAFRYFLAIEQARAERARRPICLLMAAMEPLPDKPVPMSPASATSVFVGLRAVLRDTDVVGWFRQDVVAGVVLGASAPSTGAEMSAFERRVEHGLRRRLPLSLAATLRVRVVRWPIDADERRQL